MKPSEPFKVDRSRPARPGRQARGAAVRGLALVLALTGSGFAQADDALANSKGCMGCHAINGKVVGPGFSDVAARYAKAPAAPELLAKNIVNGSKGAWGEMAMPAQNHVSLAEAEALARWVLAQRK